MRRRQSVTILGIVDRTVSEGIAVGLAVVAYTGMGRLDLDPGFGGLDEGDIPAHHAALEAGSVYAFDKDVTVWSGSRREYEDWRGRLAELVAGAGRKKPFRQLIELDHDEDVIGSYAAARLARDFAEWDDSARECGDGFYGIWTALRRGCEIAADRGAVEIC